VQVMMQSANPVQTAGQGQKETTAAGNGNPIFALLLQSTGKTSVENSTLGDAVQSLLQITGEDLKALWNPDAANDEDVKSLLEGLPEELKDTIEALLEELPEAVTSLLAEQSASPEMKLAILVQVFYSEQNNGMTETMKKDISKLIEKWFPVLTEKNQQFDSISKQIQQIFGQIKKQMQASETQDKNAFHKIMENLSSPKKIQTFAEHAFQRYVPVKQTDQPVSQNKELQSFQSPLSPIEQWTLKVPVTQDEGEKQHFVREIQQIISRGKLVVTESGFTKLQIKLNPEHLGNLEIQLIQRHGEIAAKIVASSHAAKEAIDSQLSQLKQAFAGQNIDFEKVEVFVQTDEQAYKFTEDQGRQNEERNNHNNQSGKEDADSISLSFEEHLSQLVINEKV
jgi:flagellar hook-length control protein FliK